MSDPNNPGQPTPPAAPPPPPAAPPPAQGWQSTPQPPMAPPPAGGQPGGMPPWTGNITAKGTIPGPGGVALANMTDRIVALIIDSIILFAVGFVLALILGSVLVETRTEVIFGIPVTVRGPSVLAGILTAVILVGLNAAYYIFQWSRMDGSTVGMKVMKIAVRDASTGGPISQGQAINRWIPLGGPQVLYFVPVIGLLASIAALVWYIFLLVTTAQSPTRQGFHDTFAKTIVAKLG